MEQREVVLVLYVLGASVTATGVLVAFFQATRHSRRFDAIARKLEAIDDVDFGAVFDPDPERTARQSTRDAELAKVKGELEDLGITDGGPSWNDMAMPLAYWSKRSALADTVASFRVGGLVALFGLLLSTVASIWSLYL